MTNPRFSVGETVLLRSRQYPELNGTYVVKKRWSSVAGCFSGCWRNNAYSIGITGPDDDHDGWCECALRKKPDDKPAEEEFTSWLKKLGNPVKEGV